MFTITDRGNFLPLMAGLAVISVTLLMVGGRQTPSVEVRGTERPAAERLVHFEDASDGSVVIRDAENSAVLARFPVAEGGFVRGSIRALARERRQEGQGREAPFRLAAWSDGQLTLDDAATGRRIDLTAFGATNAGVFSRLLTAQGED
jgi:putative photosynthetic complex assembly protein